jgi:isoleucyl-tRNA synthetase
VIFDPTLNERVTKICKPDGKIIGAKFGWHTKQIFELAKSWVFVESSDGSVVVWERLLEPGSFEISYIKKDESDSVEVEEGIAMEIDWNLTDELVLEWYARDVVRSIQDWRKEADYDIADRIYLQIIGWKFAEDLINHHGMYIQEETLSTISYTISEYDLTKSLELWWQTLTFMLKKNS